jgi:hypothetical protein
LERGHAKLGSIEELRILLRPANLKLAERFAFYGPL